MAEWFDEFLIEREPLPWETADGMPASIKPCQVFLQDADFGLEVAIARSAHQPKNDDLRKAWKARNNDRSVPVLLAVGYPDGDGTLVAVCGPVGPQPSVIVDLEPTRVERLARTALNEESRHAAQRFLIRTVPELGSEFPGLYNSGLFAMHELRAGVPQRNDWASAVKLGKPLLSLSGRALIEGLGFTVDGSEAGGANASMLKAGKDRRAVAVFLDGDETFDAAGKRFDGVSPVSYALAVAKREHVSWVLLTRKSEIRLYAARPDTGVGRRGPSQTYVELQLAMLPDDAAGYLQLLFSAEALKDGGSVDEILGQSADFAADLATSLRDRVYGETVPAIARALAARIGPDPSNDDLKSAYDQTLHILFRLLFVAYGEDKELLPYRTNSRYQDHSLKRIARRIADDFNAGRETFDEHAFDLWEDVVQIWVAVDKGNRGWGVPAYNGGLFSDDIQTSAAGAALRNVQLTNAEFGPALAALLLDRNEDGEFGPVDFRSLSVREFGTLYEGLLESELSLAPVDLSVDRKGTYVPAIEGSEVLVSAGTVYLHNQSGERKATGSYFTKPFAVEHLLDQALEPALSDHLVRIEGFLDANDEAGAAEAFFDFRCADIAMGSGHFLVAAVDRIEARLSSFLALNPIPRVNAELERLRAAAYEALGELGDGIEIETTSLLRRQVGRRCIYGVDINRVAVELARVAIWIHTFVPGLPLSFLDHNLVHGNALTGVGTVDEAVAVLTRGRNEEGSLSRTLVNGLLQRAEKALKRLAATEDASLADVKRSQQAHIEALASVGPAAALFDLIVANRLEGTPLPEVFSEEGIALEAERLDARSIASSVGALHFPIAFPEVFLRDHSGFDCVLGNPPWKEQVVEDLAFWAQHFPGLNAMTNAKQKAAIARLRVDRPDLVDQAESLRVRAQRMRAALVRGPFPGMGTGDPDLYKAFCWRFTRLAVSNGWIGVVLPRSVFATLGSADWRRETFNTRKAEIVLCVNRREWLFESVNPGYSVCLFVAGPAANESTVAFRGGFHSLSEYREGMQRPPAVIPLTSLASSDPEVCIPAVQSAAEFELFGKLVRSPNFGSPDRSDWRAIPATEIHATNDAARFFTHDPNDDPVYNHLNVGQFVFDPSAGSFDWAVRSSAYQLLEAKRAATARRGDSPFRGMSDAWVADQGTLPVRNPRIVFRDVVHATNPRKVWAALAPANTLLTNKAPYLVFWAGDIRAQAYVLGALGSAVVDWFGQLRVNLNLNFFILNSIPVPPMPTGPLADRIVRLAGGLSTAANGDFGAWAALGEPINEPDDRKAAQAELDALFTLLYDIEDQYLSLIFSADHRSDIEDVLRFRSVWNET